MWARFIPLATCASAALLAAGCFLDSGAFPPEGAGGQGAAGSGGSSGGTTDSGTTDSGTTDSGSTDTGGSGGATTATTPPECTAPGDCPGQGPCATAACTAAKCVYSFAPAGTLVADDSATDCVRVECDGRGAEVTAADPDDVPDADPTDCVAQGCDGTQITSANVPDGTLCGAQPRNECKEQACASGACALQDKPDGTLWTDPYPEDCGAAECHGGGKFFIGGFNGMCGSDSTPTDCTAPFCGVYSDKPAECSTQNLPQGTPCKKANGQNGSCNGFGSCF